MKGITFASVNPVLLALPDKLTCTKHFKGVLFFLALLIAFAKSIESSECKKSIHSIKLGESFGGILMTPK